jgi:hypothetical protein
MTKDPAILRDSQNPRELTDTARLYAASPDPADQQLVALHLGSPAFLGKLDPPEAYQVFQPHQLRAAGIVKTLMDNDSPAGRQTLVSLTTSAGFLSYDSLAVLLIRALAVDRPASARTIAYWEKHLQPESPYATNVVDAIVENHSRPALDLFVRAMNNPAHEDGYKYVWLRDVLLRRRNEPEVLACCERMIINRTVDPGWHEPILEALFDYDPTWYLSCRKPRPPLRVLAPDESKGILGRLARHAMVDPRMEFASPELGLKIRLAMKEIGRSLDEEQEGAGNAKT